MDPTYKDTKRNKQIADWYCHVKEACYGVAERCPCGGEIIQEEHEGKRYFTCCVYKDEEITDAHYRRDWVYAIEEEVQLLRKEVNEQSDKIRSFASLERQIEVLRAELKNNVEDMKKLKNLVG